MNHMAGKPEEMQDLVARIARAVVDDSCQLMVEALEYSGGTWLRIWVAQSDVGKMTGQQNRTVGAIRAILAAVTKKHHHLYMLDVCEDANNQDAVKERSAHASSTTVTADMGTI
jgi:predicted RNA-binding protein YlqC (UPF0109 family)